MHRFTGCPLDTCHAPPTAKEYSEYFSTTPLHQVPREDAVDENTKIPSTMMINGSPLTMFAKQTNLLSDYDGVRMAWDWRGANALCPCLLCTNVFKKDSDLCNRPGIEDSMYEDKVEPQPTDMSRLRVAHVNDDGGSNVCFLATYDVFSEQGLLLCSVGDEDGDAAPVDDDARRFLYTMQYKRKADKITQEPLTHMRWCYETRHKDLEHVRKIDAFSSMVLRGIDASRIEVRRKAT